MHIWTSSVGILTNVIGDSAMIRLAVNSLLVFAVVTFVYQIMLITMCGRKKSYKDSYVEHVGLDTSSETVAVLNKIIKWQQLRDYTSNLNCSTYFDGDQVAINQAKQYMKMNPRTSISDKDFTEFTRNCTLFKHKLGYMQYSLSGEEVDFPIAFSILFYKDLEQVEYLLRTIYRANNWYCLHLDADAPEDLLAATRSLVTCFDNVFLASHLESIVYAGYPRLQAEINCMTDMLSVSPDWKYYLNLASQAFPLKTNAELVKILKIYNGSNDIESSMAVNHDRYKNVFAYEPPEVVGGKMRIFNTGKAHIEPPHNITIVKGSAYGAFSRSFVEFIIHDKKANDFLEWSKRTYSPDEQYWSTLNTISLNPQLNTPGGYTGNPRENFHNAIYVNWDDPCRSKKYVHGVCILGIDDLHPLSTKIHLIANKFLFDFEYAALHCMAEWIHNKTTYPPQLDTDTYKSLPFVH